MILSDIVEEILEKVGNGSGRSISMNSIVRKINNKLRELRREYSRNDDDVAVLDILSGVAEYPLPCAAGSITSVYVNNHRMPFRVRNDYFLTTYYYLLDKTIGLYLYGKEFPASDMAEGLKIYHKHVPVKLTVQDMEAEPDLEEDFRMLLVYGVLIDIAEPNMVGYYQNLYRSLLHEYVAATRDPETTQVNEVYYP